MPWACGHGLGLAGSGALRDVLGARRLLGDCVCEHILGRQGYIDGGISNKRIIVQLLCSYFFPLLGILLFQICFQEEGDQYTCLDTDTQSRYYSRVVLCKCLLFVPLLF